MVNVAFSGMAKDTVNVCAKGFSDAITGGNANLLSICIDWIVQHVTKEGKAK